MMKRVILSLLILTIMLVCTGCPLENVFLSSHQEAFHLVNAEVPVADHMGKLTDRVKKLGEDEYGRCLYSYKTTSVALNHEFIEIYIISQNETKDKIYYYPDYCYIVRIRDEGSFSEEEIAALKERNDWGKPLNEDKMRTIPNHDLDHVQFRDLDAALYDYLGLDGKNCIPYAHCMKINDANQQMFICLVRRETTEEGQKPVTNYLVVYQTDRYPHIVAIEEFEPSLDCQDAMHEFRTTWFEPGF